LANACSNTSFKKYPEAVELRLKYRKYLDLMANTSLTVFYEGSGNIRTVSLIKNTTAQPHRENYASQIPCGSPCYLDDPYEGETMAFFMDLYGDWKNGSREDIWIKKRDKLISVNYPTPLGNITCQKGWWFSSHEQWKYLLLPYNDVPVNRRIFVNGERARAYNSFYKRIPGMFSSVTNVTHPTKSGYLSACGIQEIAFENVTVKDVVTPYAVYPIFLANQTTIALLHYHNMIVGSKMQNIYGSTESVTIDGKRICPLLTWDSKITTVVAMLGGITEIVRSAMIEDGTYSRFLNIVDREWGRVFRNFEGEQIPFQAPSTEILNVLGNFTTCSK